jgi:glycosyltransferase involved in cell wall biosynthesis
MNPLWTSRPQGPPDERLSRMSDPAIADSIVSRRPHYTVYMMDLAGVLSYYVGHLCRSLMDEGVDVTLGSVTPFRDPSYFAGFWLRRDAVLIDLAGLLQVDVTIVRRPLKFLQLITNLAILTGRFLVKRPDIIHVQYFPLIEYGFSLEIWFLSYVRRLGSKIVYTVHDLPTMRGACRRYRNIYSMADAIICHCYATQRQLLANFEVDSQKVRVVRHGPLFETERRPEASHARRSLRLPPEECIVLHQGFIRPYKGLIFLLDAWAKLGAGVASSKLVIAGDGDKRYVELISRKVGTLRFPDSVRMETRFLTVDEAIAFHVAADILIYPYSEVTTSGALMTGLSFGKPVIATALPFFEEALRGVSSTRLVPYGDVIALAEALTRAISDWQDGKRPLSSKETMRANFWQHIGRQTRDCYVEVLRDGERARSRSTTCSGEL